MDAAVILARRHWEGAVESVRAGEDVIGIRLELTPTAELVVTEDVIFGALDDGSVVFEAFGVEHGTAADICGAAAAAAVAFWRRLESGLGDAEREDEILAVLGPELGQGAAGEPFDDPVVHLVVRLHREGALKFQRVFWGDSSSPVVPDRPAPEEAVVVGQPAEGSGRAFHLPLAPEGASDPAWRRAADVGEQTGHAWRRDHGPGDDEGLDDVVRARALAAFRWPARAIVISWCATLVLAPIGILGIAMAGMGIAGSTPGGVVMGAFVSLVLFASLSMLLAVLHRYAGLDHRRRRDQREWAVEVATHRAHEAARTWRVSRVRWSAGYLE